MKTKFFKRGLFVFFALVLVLAVAAVSNVEGSSRPCRMNVTLLNQDPFPAMPGERVELVFQIYELSDKTCDGASLRIVPVPNPYDYYPEDYPFALSRGEKEKIEAPGGRWSSAGYRRDIVRAFKLDVHEDAEGWYDLEVRYSEKDVDKAYAHKDFKVKVEDVQTDFELGIRDYNPNTRELTLEILNVGGNDVEALVLEIPQQDNIGFMGSNRNVIGILDSNEDTSARFRVSDVKEGEIEVTIKYNDEINERREITKNVYFNPDLFKHDLNDGNGLGISTILIALIVIALIVYWVYRRKKKKKKIEEIRKKS